jgi:hypothetical protein
VLRVELKALAGPRHDDVETLLTGRATHHEVGDDALAGRRGAGELHLHVAALGGVAILHRAAAEGDGALDVLGQASAPGREKAMPPSDRPVSKSMNVTWQNAP